jgi:hypothetical protein
LAGWPPHHLPSCQPAKMPKCQTKNGLTCRPFRMLVRRRLSTHLLVCLVGILAFPFASLTSRPFCTWTMRWLSTLFRGWVVRCAGQNATLRLETAQMPIGGSAPRSPCLTTCGF